MGALNLLRYKELPIKRGEPSMSDYVIITDTSADIPADILDKGQIHLIPMVYQLNGEECPHRNPGNWDSRAFYDKLRAGGTGSTSQISPATYTDFLNRF